MSHAITQHYESHRCSCWTLVSAATSSEATAWCRVSQRPLLNRTTEAYQPVVSLQHMKR